MASRGVGDACNTLQFSNQTCRSRIPTSHRRHRTRSRRENREARSGRGDDSATDARRCGHCNGRKLRCCIPGPGCSRAARCLRPGICAWVAGVPDSAGI